MLTVSEAEGTSSKCVDPLTFARGHLSLQQAREKMNRNHGAGREQVFVQRQAESRLTRGVQFTSLHTATEHLSLCRVPVGTEARPRPGYSHRDVKR